MYVLFGKRIWDIAIGLIALPFVLLIIAVLAPLIKLEDGGPVFYNAPRVGKDGVDFKMYKLRSMRVNAPDLIMEDGSTYNGADDPRMTKIGAFMRKTSLDEMPQFFNVLLGDMSVVGPRPAIPSEVAAYTPRQRQRLQSAFLRQNSLTVLHAQNIVRACQKVPRALTHGLCSLLARGGKGQACGKPFAQAPGKCGPHQSLCRAQVCGGVRRFGAIAQRLHAAQGAQRTHPGSGKGLGTGRRVRRGQAQHQVCPARKRRLCAHLHGHQRQAAPLHHAGAHHAHHGVEAQRAHLPDLVCMPVVKRVVFSNDACNAHASPSSLPAGPQKRPGRPFSGRLALENRFFSLYNKFGKEKRCRAHRNVGGKT